MGQNQEFVGYWCFHHIHIQRDLDWEQIKIHNRKLEYEADTDWENLDISSSDKKAVLGLEDCKRGFYKNEVQSFCLQILAGGTFEDSV